MLLYIIDFKYIIEIIMVLVGLDVGLHLMIFFMLIIFAIDQRLVIQVSSYCKSEDEKSHRAWCCLS